MPQIYPHCQSNVLYFICIETQIKQTIILFIQKHASDLTAYIVQLHTPHHMTPGDVIKSFESYICMTWVSIFLEVRQRPTVGVCGI